MRTIGADHQTSSKTLIALKDNNSKEILQMAADYGILDMQNVTDVLECMRRKELLSMHKHEIFQNKSTGLWYTHIYENGKRLTRKRKTKQELENYLVGFYKEQEEVIFIKDVFKMWSDEKLRYKEIQKGSYDRYQTDFKRFFPASMGICRKKFKNITEEDLEEFIKDTISRLSLSQRGFNGLKILLNGIFKYGKKKGYTTLSITQFMGDLLLSKGIFAPASHKKEEETFSEEEQKVIHDYLIAHPDIWNLGIHLQFKTGVRVGELAALKHSDIGNGYIHICRTEHKCRDEDGKWRIQIKETPKTEAGNREVIIPPQAIETIEMIKKLNPSGEYLFMNNGKRIRGNTFNKRLSDVCNKIGILHHSTHKIRKTYGTTLIDNDVLDSIVAEQMGHKDINTTRKFYYYSNKGRKKKIEQITNAISF